MLGVMAPKFMQKRRPFLALLFSAVSSITAQALALAPGDAPEFSAKNQDGKLIRSADLKGHYVLIYFYPKDETPGCTKQACDLRDRYVDIKKLNTVVLGVSRQDAKSHRKFIDKHKLPFDLLVDSDGKVGEALGVGSIPLIGFSRRSSILLGPDGKVLKIYEDVDPKQHVGLVLADLQGFQPKSDPVKK